MSMSFVMMACKKEERFYFIFSYLTLHLALTTLRVFKASFGERERERDRERERER
jgi:hypothetical protein